MLNIVKIVHKNQATCLLWDGGQNTRAQTATCTVAMLQKTPASFSERALVTGAMLSASKARYCHCFAEAPKPCWKLADTIACGTSSRAAARVGSARLALSVASAAGGARQRRSLSHLLQPQRRKRLLAAMLRSSQRLLGATCSWTTFRMIGTPYRLWSPSWSS